MKSNTDKLSPIFPVVISPWSEKCPYDLHGLSRMGPQYHYSLWVVLYRVVTWPDEILSHFLYATIPILISWKQRYIRVYKQNKMGSRILHNYLTRHLKMQHLNLFCIKFTHLFSLNCILEYLSKHHDLKWCNNFLAWNTRQIQRSVSWTGSSEISELCNWLVTNMFLSQWDSSFIN